MSATDTSSDTTDRIQSLTNDGLLHERGLIGGRWLAADDGRCFPVLDPATGEQIAEVPRMGSAETRAAIEAAEAALPAWRSRTAAERAAVLRRWAEELRLHVEALALLMTMEQGKPLAE